MQLGYKLATEQFAPKELIRQAVAAEQAGFDFIEMSDHFHPWLDEQGHSAFTWNLLSAIAMKTTTLKLVTGVTCPSYRYHPAIIAQAAATLAIISDDRFTLGVGAGERLNEHVIGQEFHGVKKRHQVFCEALDIINLLWKGGYQSYDGKFLQLEDARVFDLPDKLPDIVVAGSGPASARIAAEKGHGIFATEPKADMVKTWQQHGGSGPAYAEVPFAYADNEDDAAEHALKYFPWALTGWKVMAELPNTANFKAATSTVRLEDIKNAFACGNDPAKGIANAQSFINAGFDHLVLMNAGPDIDGFMDFFKTTLSAKIRALA